MDSQHRNQMQANVQGAFGRPGPLQRRQILRPLPALREVLVKEKATGLQVADGNVMRRTPIVVRSMYGLFRPRPGMPGRDLTGRPYRRGGGGWRGRHPIAAGRSVLRLRQLLATGRQREPERDFGWSGGSARLQCLARHRSAQVAGEAGCQEARCLERCRLANCVQVRCGQGASARCGRAALQIPSA